MKKLLLILSCGLAFSVANAATTVASAPASMDSAHPVPADCKVQASKMKTGYMAVESAIKQNDANKVGKLVIKAYNENQAFLKTHPECKMKRGMFGKMYSQHDNASSAM